MTNLSRRDFWTTLLAMFGIGATAGVEWDVLTSGNAENGGGFLPTLNFHRDAFTIIYPPAQEMIRLSCPWNFPATADERHQAADIGDSEFFECGYSPERGYGRNDPETRQPYTSCDHTWEDCVARQGLMFGQVHHARYGRLVPLA